MKRSTKQTYRDGHLQVLARQLIAPLNNIPTLDKRLVVESAVSQRDSPFAVGYAGLEMHNDRSQ
ncbi:hypothetical protein KIN20_034813 [Parelaphostrongylus tenuis]|uniref:Uncharacterized protein n=1 Tax=Parelaphostrongylus tenuis TaxID=148309 RepID=A0AAD5RAZ4_PARTN|nr:hypothetical protein KIN20_034813 [Parelaphostrongylus tenuis]